MGCLRGIAKLIVFVFNFLCALVGIVLISVGSLFYTAIDKYYELTQQNLNVAPSLVIAVGVIIFIIAFLGCCGVKQKSRCMLYTYATILLILFVIQIVAGAYGYVQVKQNGADIKQELLKSMNTAFEKYNEIPGIKDLFNTMQLQLKCCGVTSSSDYKDGAPPVSCCGKENKNDSCDTYYIQGCHIALYNFVTDKVEIVADVAFGICAIELIGAIFAIYLGRKIEHY